METGIFLGMVLVGGIVLVYIRHVWLAIILVVALTIYVLFRAGSSVVQGAVEGAKHLSTGVAEEVEGAGGVHATPGVLKGDLGEAGKKLGDHVFATDAHRFTMKPWAHKLGDGVRELINGFKKLFGD